MPCECWLVWEYNENKKRMMIEYISLVETYCVQCIYIDEYIIFVKRDFWTSISIITRKKWHIDIIYAFILCHDRVLKVKWVSSGAV